MFAKKSKQDLVASGVVSRPKGKLVTAPGESLQEFIDILATELDRKRTEYFVVGLCDDWGVPQYMVELRGRSLWVTYDVEDMLQKAKQIGTKAIVLLHNHPTSSIIGPSLQPSDMDIRSGYAFYLRCERVGFEFLGDFIVSGGGYREYLMQLIEKAEKFSKESEHIESKPNDAISETDQK